MYMTDEEKYSAVLKELGELLQSKNTTISCLKWQVEELEAKLKELEVRLKEAEADCMEWERIADELAAAMDEIKGEGTQC